jgi:catechol 2,3-dioxygenase-like lactoylglutathione lyase family enzyme
MLKDHSSSAIIAISDLDRARKFYGETLGLELESEFMGHVLTYRTGSTRLNVYKSGAAGTNKANAVVWGVGDDIDAIVAALKARGVTFEHYDMPGATLQGDIHVSGDMKTAWFKDPDGNILHINSM